MKKLKRIKTVVLLKDNIETLKQTEECALLEDKNQNKFLNFSLIFGIILWILTVIISI